MKLRYLLKTRHLILKKNYLEKELNEIIKGDARFITVEETEQRLEKIIRQHENPV